MTEPETSELFEKINQLGHLIHDDQTFKEIQSILAKFKNTQQRRNLLAPKMLRAYQFSIANWMDLTQKLASPPVYKSSPYRRGICFTRINMD